MKKGFTMIELIFVIVILGILASVAIPRLAATREDAEISTAVANIRTLLSDISAYYAVKGSFNDVKWKDITNVPLQMRKGQAVVNQTADTFVYLAAGGENCIGVQLVNRDGNKPAHIKFDTDVPVNEKSQYEIVQEHYQSSCDNQQGYRIVRQVDALCDY